MIANTLNNGVLLWIDGGAWGNSKKLSDELMQEAGLPKKAVRANQDLVDRDKVREITGWIAKAHNWANLNSMPWLNKGVHFIHKDKVIPQGDNEVSEVDEVMQGFQKGLHDAVDNFLMPDNERQGISDYEICKNSFKKDFPKLYNESYYPSSEELKRKFRLRYGIQLITMPSDGKVQVLSQERLVLEDRKYRERIKEVAEQSIVMVRQMFLEMVKKLQERLEDPNKVFKNSTVEKPKEFLETFFQSMNLFGDKPFENACKQIKDILSGVEADDLRTDEEYREVMAGVTKSIVQSIDNLPRVRMAIDFELD